MPMLLEHAQLLNLELKEIFFYVRVPSSYAKWIRFTISLVRGSSTFTFTSTFFDVTGGNINKINEELFKYINNVCLNLTLNS
jgi:hypothetical protein